MTDKNASCEICAKNNHKYKCPGCLLKYCSVPCYKVHKDSGCVTMKVQPDANAEDTCTMRKSESKPPDVQYDKSAIDTEDRVPHELLNKLGQSKAIKQILHNPALQDMLLNLDSSQKPAVSISIAMQEPIFTEFANKCLKVVEPENNNSMERDLPISDSDSDF